LEVYNFEEVTSNFNAEQLNQIERETGEILIKMNSVRTTPDKSILKKEDCVLLRHLSENTVN